MRELRRNEEGQALPLVLFAMFVLSLTTAAVLTGSAVNHRSALVSSQAKQAFALAQHGLADAEGDVYSSFSTGCGGTCVPESTVTTDEGSFTYSGTLAGTTWTLTATGTVENVSRTVSTQVVANTQTTTTSTQTPVPDPSIWSYIYVDGSSGACTTIQGGSQVKVPLYTPGNLCFTGGSGSKNPAFTGSSLQVGGYLSVPDSGAYIGSSSSKIATLQVHGTCTQQKSGQYWPCNGNGPTIWATNVGSTLSPTLTMPTYDVASYYAAQSSSTITGCPAGLLDNDGTLNTSAGVVNPFPTNSSYDCKVGSNELKWNSVGSWSQGTLNITGSFVFDGSLDLTGGMHVVYRGGGTLFFAGGVTIEGGSSICGGNSGSTPLDCTGWDPGDYNLPAKASTCAASSACNVMILAASCFKAGTASTSGGPNPCFDVTGGTTVQAGIYAAQNYTLEGGSSAQGPVICESMTVQGGTNIVTMLPFTQLPANAPQDWTTTTTTTTQTTTTSLATPSGWSG
jgi:Tfp pilus assembly protein PilX